MMYNISNFNNTKDCKGCDGMKRIAVIPNHGKDIGLVHTKAVVECMRGKAAAVMDTMYSDIGLAEGDAVYAEGDAVFDNADAVIILGGDGTILQIAEVCARRGLPIMGINLGRIGFMSEVELDDAPEMIDRLIAGDYRTEKRMMLKIETFKNGKSSGKYHALNDVSITKAAGEKLISIDLHSGGDKVNNYIADGIIISSPTGSTGYSLSAGGPVVDPSMELFIATPICAHMLSSRSAVLPADKAITISLDARFGGHNAVVSTDGDIKEHLQTCESVVITRSCYETSLVKMGNRSFYDTLITKLS